MKNIITKVKSPMFISIGIIFISSVVLQIVQIQNKNLYLGIDWIFHYNRFYDAAQQIREGNLQYFVSMYGFSQSGRIVNALYGPLFAYFNGLLILLFGSWLRYQLVSNFLITFLSSLSMFALLVKSKVRPSISILLSLLYSTLYTVQAWSFNQHFTAWGAVIIPIGIFAATKFLEDGNDNERKNMLMLSFVVTLSIQIHVLTTLFLVIILSVFFIIGIIISRNRVKLFGWVVKAALLTTFMTANVWYPLLETNIENNLLSPWLNLDMDGTALKLTLFNFPGYITLVVLALFFLQFILT